MREAEVLCSLVERHASAAQDGFSGTILETVDGAGGVVTGSNGEASSLPLRVVDPGDEFVIKKLW